MGVVSWVGGVLCDPRGKEKVKMYKSLLPALELSVPLMSYLLSRCEAASLSLK